MNRLEDQAQVCNTGRLARVSSYFPHLGEEDCLRGWNGSGTIFFSLCNLRCVFCQNHDISQAGEGVEVTPDELAAMMLDLQRVGCHNINFVTPEHVVPQILEALPLAVDARAAPADRLQHQRLRLHGEPGLLDGVVDIYMPDFKLWERSSARRC